MTNPVKPLQCTVLKALSRELASVTSILWNCKKDTDKLFEWFQTLLLIPRAFKNTIIVHSRVVEFCLHFHMSERGVQHHHGLSRAAASNTIIGFWPKCCYHSILGENTRFCALPFPKWYHVVNMVLLWLSYIVSGLFFTIMDQWRQIVDKNMLTWTKAHFLQF